MRLPTKERATPLARQVRENRERHRRQEEQRHSQNEQVLARLRSGSGSRSA